jgi:integrase/recombinase XerD
MNEQSNLLRSWPFFTTEPQSDINYRDVLELYLQTFTSDNTRDTYGRNVERFFNLVGKKDLSQVSSMDFLKFKIWIEQKLQDRINGLSGFSNDSVRTIIYSIRSFFSWTSTFGFTCFDPKILSKIFGRLLKAKELSPREILTKSEAEKLLSVITNLRDMAITYLFMESGIRVSELCHLHCGDVYQTDAKYFVHVANGKGNRDRDVQIPEAVFQKIQSYVQETRTDLTDNGFLFLSRKQGNRLSRSQVFRLIKSYTKKAGLKKNISPHSLRHSYSSHLRKAGTFIEKVARHLGHSSVATTQRYTKPFELEAEVLAKGWLMAS